MSRKRYNIETTKKIKNCEHKNTKVSLEEYNWVDVPNNLIQGSKLEFVYKPSPVK